ncbi:MAG: YigZ family protein [Candidatus Delongbacteria bacterium]|nr:YigZ family protein [Candidatus Delongbacteria bacterium]
MQKEAYKTIAFDCETEIEKIKGSWFIGRLYRIESRDDAELKLDEIRKKYYDATHNCFAYSAGIEDPAVTRSSDDGEPSGTAGRPMLTVLESSGLKNVLLVVTRYYGGTNLGTGGLIKAYTEASKAVIAAAEIEEVEIRTDIRFSYSYDMTSLVMSVLSKYSCVTVTEDFNGGAKIIVSVNKGYAKDFIKEIFERSNGVIGAEIC